MARAEDLARVLEEASRGLPPGLRQKLAEKPSPWLVKAHDVGEPTDVHRDIPWHLLDKEKDPRFDLSDRGRLGVFNTNADLFWLIGVGDGQDVDFDPPRRYTDHLVDLAVQQFNCRGLQGTIAFLPVSSATLLAVVQLRNRGEQPAVCELNSLCRRPPPAVPRPVEKYGYGIHVTGGRWLESGRGTLPGGSPPAADALPFLWARYAEWDQKGERDIGTLLCALAADPPGAEGDPPGVDRAVAIAPTASPAAEIRPRELLFTRHRVGLSPGESRLVRLALHVRRYADAPFTTRRHIDLYPSGDHRQAEASAAGELRKALSAAWPELLFASYKWYERMPVLHLPRPDWETAVCAALELPRGNTWSPQEKIGRPWYTFCRVHGHDPYGWWSYGMHAHEHLNTFVAGIVDPGLSQNYLRGHFQVQGEDGCIQYGVNHRLANIHAGLATCPLLMWESWQAYLWSGDRAFLREAFAAGRRYLAWWCSPARTRGGLPLQHWKNYVETVRDDADLATWAATDGAENQEALDLNCYLLNEERTLSAMAAELGDAPGQAYWQERADRRQKIMRELLWHPGDGLYYGRDLLGDRWARVPDISTFFPLWCGLAEPSQAPHIVRLLRDPEAFDTAWPVASLAVRHMPERQRGVYHWRGANWVQMSWLVILGLKRYGYLEEAARLAEANSRMVFETLTRTGHFREYYNSLTGEPADLTDYIWTCLPAAMIVDVILGVRPVASGLEIHPCLPAGWEHAAIDNLHVREHVIAVEVRRDPMVPERRVWIDGRLRDLDADGATLVPWRDLPPRTSIRVSLPGER